MTPGPPPVMTPKPFSTSIRARRSASRYSGVSEVERAEPKMDTQLVPSLFRVSRAWTISAMMRMVRQDSVVMALRSSMTFCRISMKASLLRGSQKCFNPQSPHPPTGSATDG